jgi:hypothetical protein
VASYLASKGALFTNKDAQFLGTYFKQMGDLDSLSPPEVVDSAKPEGSPIHSYFEWDDEKCGIAHRLNQARHYLSHIIVVTEHCEEPIRAFHVVTISEDQKPQYVHIERIMREPGLLKQIRDSALRELKTWERTYKQYDELKLSVALVGQAIQQLVLAEVATAQT